MQNSFCAQTAEMETIQKLQHIISATAIQEHVNSPYGNE
jgi:hypothetical protein